jgi:rod shape-determining protein MreC
VARNRTARLAVLGSAQRSAPTPYSSRASSVLRRRAIAVALVVVSLALITVYFRESHGGRLHGIQGAGATVLRPFEIGATHVAQPFRDVYGYFSGLVHAKSRVGQLETELAQLRQRQVAALEAENDLSVLRKELHYKAPPAVQDLKRVNTSVIAQPVNPFDQTIIISAGANDGVRAGNPVLDPDGNLVGTVSLAYSTTAQVTLLTDESSAVGAKDPQTAAQGVVKDASGSSDALILERVSKAEKIREGDQVITSGFKVRPHLASLYPKGILIGWVSSVQQFDTDVYKRVQVKPYADFSNLQSVMVVLTPKGIRGLP